MADSARFVQAIINLLPVLCVVFGSFLHRIWLISRINKNWLVFWRAVVVLLITCFSIRCAVCSAHFFLNGNWLRWQLNRFDARTLSYPFSFVYGVFVFYSLCECSIFVLHNFFSAWFSSVVARTFCVYTTSHSISRLNRMHVKDTVRQHEPAWHDSFLDASNTAGNWIAWNLLSKIMY